MRKTREDELHDDGPAAKTRWDELAMVTAAVDTAVTKQLQGREEQVHEDDQRHEKRVDAEFVKLKEVATQRCQEAQPLVQHAPRSLRPRKCKNGVGGASRVIGDCRSAPALLHSMDGCAGDLQLL